MNSCFYIIATTEENNMRHVSEVRVFVEGGVDTGTT